MTPPVHRRRGPRKGDGGRPKVTLANDPDRFAVALGMFLTINDRTAPQAAAKLADLILADGSETSADNLPRGLSLRNGAGADFYSSEVWRERTLAPDGSRQWRGRLAILQRKMTANYAAADAQWIADSMLAMEMAASIQCDVSQMGRSILAELGWRALPAAAIDRLRRLLSIENRGLIRAGRNTAIEFTVMRRDPGEVIWVEGSYRLHAPK